MRKELKRRINKMMNELQAMKELIDSDALQEQPDNEDVDKVAQELYEHLYELKRRNNVPTNLYDKQEIIDLWKAGIVYGRSHSKQEQPEAECKDLEEAAEESWIYYEYRDSGHLYSSVYKDAFKAGAEWDAEHFRDTTKKVSKDLEEAAKEYDEAESWRYEALKYPRREAFKAGAEWQKRRERLEVDLDDEIHKKAMLLHTAPCYDELRDFAYHFYERGFNARK